MASVGEVAAGAAVELLFAVIAAAVLYRVFGWFTPVPKRHLVEAFQSAVVLQRGRAAKVVGPGAYWVTPGRLIRCDMRPTPFQVHGQELLAADNLRLRVSLGGEYKIVDPALFVAQSSDAFAQIYLQIRHVLRSASAEMGSETLLGSQGQLTARMKELLLPHEASLGVQVIQLDVYETVPIGELRET